MKWGRANVSFLNKKSFTCPYYVNTRKRKQKIREKNCENQFRFCLKMRTGGYSEARGFYLGFFLLVCKRVGRY